MFESISLRLFGKLLIPSLDYFGSLKESMRKARMPYSLHEYVSMVFFSSFMTLVVFLAASIFVVSILFPSPLAYVFAVFLSLISGVSAFSLGYYYPSLKAKNLRMSIERALPFSIFYMATTASSGAHPLNIFKMLSIRGGPVGDEASKIYANVKAMGMDINTAIARAASRTPSVRFAELLWGMVSVLTTGGSLESYLKGRTRAAMALYRRTLDEYAKAIAFYTEIYITLIIVGSLFFIILLAIISPLVGGNTLFLQTFLVFFFIPLVSVGFIMLLKGASPTE